MYVKWKGYGPRRPPIDIHVFPLRKNLEENLGAIAYSLYDISFLNIFELQHFLPHWLWPSPSPTLLETEMFLNSPSGVLESHWMS